MASAQANLYNYVAPYLINGIYKIDVQTISKRDETRFIKALSKKKIWFIDELRLLFQDVCIHSSINALNAAAFMRIGYKLYPAGYSISSSYDSILDYFDKEVFCEDIVNINDIDNRIKSLSMFQSYLDRMKTNMEYLEVNPKIYMSIGKIGELFDINKDDILNIQRLFSRFCTEQYFNGNSIWTIIDKHLMYSEIEPKSDKEAIVKYLDRLKENRWFLTSILKNQSGVFSMRTSEAVILSKDNNALNLADICSWIVAKEGKMSINDLTTRFNDLFGAMISRRKIVEKIRERHLWNVLVTDQIDDYISNLLDTIDSDRDDEELFAEEFF